jgi:hypothetical protein
VKTYSTAKKLTEIVGEDLNLTRVNMGQLKKDGSLTCPRANSKNRSAGLQPAWNVIKTRKL